jgi:glycosyltransferase involved in cell wall biosynthesis
MRVLLVSREYPPETAKGGIGTQTYAKAQGLARLGHEVHVISQSTDGARREYRDAGVFVTRIAGTRGTPLYTVAAEWITYSAMVAAEVARLAERAPPDVVDFPEWGGEGYLHVLNQSPWNRIPTVIQIHGPAVMFAHTIGWPEPGSDLYRVATEMERTCLLLADGIYSSSGYSSQWCVRHYGLAPGSIPTLHAGVDTQVFRPRNVPKEPRPTIICAGRITRNKGVDVLVEAACSLRREFPELRLRLLGRGDDVMPGELRDRAARSGDHELLDIVGFVDRAELPVHLSRAHIYAGPSRCEGGPGMSYLEAMACGLPVVASAGSGASEVVDDGGTGLLVPPGDAQALAAALRRLLASRALRESMGANGRQYVREQAEAAICLRNLEAYYASIVAAHQRGLAAWAVSGGDGQQQRLASSSDKRPARASQIVRSSE